MPQAHVSKQALCKGKARYGGMDVSDAKRLGALEAENMKLKRLLAEAMLDSAVAKGIANAAVTITAPSGANEERTPSNWTTAGRHISALFEMIRQNQPNIAST